jgi:anti-sigma B factor antagonist
MMTDAHPCLLESCRVQGVTTLRFPDCTQLDEGMADALRGELIAAARANGGGRIVLDLTPIEFLTSAVLGAVLSFHRAVAAAGGTLMVANARPTVREVFAVTCLDRILDMRPA